MYLSKFNKTMPKSNEDTFDKEFLEVYGVEFFSIDNRLLHVNESTYETVGITINLLSEIISAHGGTVTVSCSSDERLYPCGVLGNYSNIYSKEIQSSPVNLEEHLYRYPDIEYDYTILTGGSIIAGRYLSSSNSRSLVVKNVKRFKLFSNLSKYIGI